MRRSLMIMWVVASFALVGCSGQPQQPEPQPQESAPSGPSTAGADSAAAGAGQSGVAEDEADGPQEGLLARRTVYFDFDSSEVRGEGTEIVAAHARFLAQNPNARVRLEGHTDERGSREYNIGLGERRAQSVRRALLLQGASDAQISTVSYGEERPAAAGSNEAAWAQNRRVELVYLRQP